MTTPALPLAEAISRHQAGLLDGVEPAYWAALERDPGQGEVHMLLGVLLSQRGEHAPAALHLERATKLCPDHAGARYNLGNVYRALERTDDALTAYDAAIARNEDHGSAHLNRGLILMETNRLAEAHASFVRVVEIDPTRVDARVQLGALCRHRSEPAEAAKWFEEAARCDPTQIDLVIEAGTACHAAGRVDDAIHWCHSVTDIAPTRVDGWCNLGGALRTAGRLEEAVEAYEQAVALDPTDALAYRGLAGTYLERRQSVSALDACRKALEIAADDPVTIRLAGLVYIKNGEIEIAETHLRRAVELAPNDLDAISELAGLRRRAGDLDEAKTLYARAIELDNTHTEAWRGQLAVARHRRDEAAVTTAVAALIEHGKRDVAAIAAVASVLASSGEHDAAAQLLRTALELPNLSRKHRTSLGFMLGDACDAASRHDDAWASYLEANAGSAPQHDPDEFEAGTRTIIAYDTHAPARTSAALTSAPRPVFIIGMPRSGTTLVEQIIAAHPGVAAAGESQLMARLGARLEDLTGCTERFPACLPDLDDDALVALETYARSELRTHTAGEAVVTEKTTGHAFSVGLLARIFPDARFIWCRRNPLDTCLSCFRQHFTGHHPYAYDLEHLGRYFRTHERMMEQWRAVSTPGTFLELVYEELVDDQRAVTAHLLEFCGLPWADACLAFEEVDRVVNTASAQQVRRPMYSDSVGRHEAYAEHLEPLRRALACGMAPAG